MRLPRRCKFAAAINSRRALQPHDPYRGRGLLWERVAGRARHVRHVTPHGATAPFPAISSGPKGPDSRATAPFGPSQTPQQVGFLRTETSGHSWHGPAGRECGSPWRSNSFYLEAIPLPCRVPSLPRRAHCPGCQRLARASLCLRFVGLPFLFVRVSREDNGRRSNF